MASDDDLLDYLFNPALQQLPVDARPDEQDTDEKTEKQAVDPKLKELEAKGVALVEKDGDVDGAIRLFSQAVELDPSYGSAYNNRAQAFLLKNKLQEALTDLNKAIELTTDRSVLGQAYAQRGIVHKRLNKDSLAVEDFKQGAKCGNTFAKIETVKHNPYAQLCNQMMEVAMKHLSGPPPDTSGASADAAQIPEPGCKPAS